MSESIEIAVARLDERFMGMQKIIAQLADDQRRMAESYEKLVESTQRISILEVDILTMKKNQEELWGKIDLIWKRFDSIAAASSKIKDKALFKVFELTAAGIVGGVVAHFGGKF